MSDYFERNLREVRAHKAMADAEAQQIRAVWERRARIERRQSRAYRALLIIGVFVVGFFLGKFEALPDSLVLGVGFLAAVVLVGHASSRD